MMQLETLSLPPLGANCYLAWEEGSSSCAVIDPGGDPWRVIDRAAALGKAIDAVLLTHGHFDHVGGAEAIVKAAGCDLWMAQGDYDVGRKDPLYPLTNDGSCEISFYNELDELKAGGLHFYIWSTAGHSWGSVCILCHDQKVIFTGDTLFAGSCGRTDLPGGDPKWMRHSLERLAELPGDYRVLPGHGSETTLERERKYNPYMKGIL